MTSDFVLPAICPFCDKPIVTLMLIICARCQHAWQWYEFVHHWLERVNADTRSVWELEAS